MKEITYEFGKLSLGCEFIDGRARGARPVFCRYRKISPDAAILLERVGERSARGVGLVCRFNPLRRVCLAHTQFLIFAETRFAPRQT